MVTYPIAIVATWYAKGVKQAEAQLKALDTSANRLRSTLARLFAAASLGYGAREVIELADSYTNLTNRLKTVTNSEAQLNAVRSETLRVANKTRQDWETTTEVYVRTAAAAKTLGFSQRQLLTFTESLNKAVALSGARPQESILGLIQLSQGLGRGVLRGDELRAVLEQLPKVADVIAEKFGVNRLQLALLGEKGKLVAKDIIDAFIEAAEKMEKEFAKTVPTIGQSFQQLKNNIIDFIGQINEFYGVGVAVNAFTTSLSNNLGTVTKAVGILAIAIGVTLARQALGFAISQIKILFALMLTNPITAFISVLAGALAYVALFSNEFKLVEGETVTLSDLFVAFYRNQQDEKAKTASKAQALSDKLTLEKEAYEKLVPEAERSAEAMRKFSQHSDEAQGSLENFLRFAAFFVDTFAGFIQLWYIRTKTFVLHGIPAIVQVMAGILTAVGNQVIDFVNNIFIKALNDMVAVAGETGKKLGLTQIDLLPQMSVDPTLATQIAQLQAGVDASNVAFNNGIGAEAALDSALRRAAEVARERELRNKQLVDLNQPGQYIPQVLEQKDKKGPKPPPTFMDEFTQLLQERSNALKSPVEKSVFERIQKFQESIKRPLSPGEQNAVRGMVESMFREEDTKNLQNYNDQLDDNIKLLQMDVRAREIEGPIMDLNRQRVTALNKEEEEALRIKLAQQQYQQDQTTITEYSKNLDFELKTIQATNREKQVALDLLVFEKQLRTDLTPEQALDLQQKALRNQLEREEIALLQEIQGPQGDYLNKIETLNNAWKKGLVTLSEYQRALTGIRLEQLSLATDMRSGLIRGVLEVQQEFTNLADVTANVVTNGFRSMEDAIVSLATTGKFQFKDMVDSIFADLMRLAVRNAITGPLANLIGLSSSGGGMPGIATSSPGTGLLGGLLGKIFGGGSAPTTVFDELGNPTTYGGGGGGLIKSLTGFFGKAGGLLGFANGGEFTVGGSGGTDSQLVAFRATPGENVRVNKAGQNNGGNTIIHVNVSTPNAESFRRSEGNIGATIAAQLRRHQTRNG